MKAEAGCEEKSVSISSRSNLTGVWSEEMRGDCTFLSSALK